jgi:glycine C-acetyltransferase
MNDIDTKRQRLEQFLSSWSPSSANQAADSSEARAYEKYTYDMFLGSSSIEPNEAMRFASWANDASRDGVWGFEAPRLGAQRTSVRLRRETGEEIEVVNFSAYNYLGYGTHPEVIAAAKDALDRYGLGAASSPVISGTMGIHKQFEERLLAFMGLPDRWVSLFSSGYGTNLGTIAAFVKPGGCVILDRKAHMSLLEGAQLSRAKILYFRHNDAEHLEQLLKGVANGHTRILVCMEGVYSADGDFAPIGELARIAKRYGAYTLVDEAHSMLLAGSRGRGACERDNALDLVDLIVMTFSKSFSGVGGALVARKAIAHYVNWYARCRMFSCALDPAVTGGMLKVLELAQGADGAARRARILENSAYLRSLLAGRVDIGTSQAWIVTVFYGKDRLTLSLNDYLQREGLDTSIMQFPAVPKGEARIRLFVTSEHTREQMDRAAAIIVRAANKFGFSRGGAST